jgi:hypothetical protein
MAFPALAPTARNYITGDFPVRNYKAQSGAEVRILYGNQRTGMTLELSYDNITDTQASTFLAHFDETKGTYLTFALPAKALDGWEGSTTALNGNGANQWRYESAPAISNVAPGISKVQVKLIGAL